MRPGSLSRLLAFALLAGPALPLATPAQSIGLLREVWENIDGEGLAGLLASPDFPNNPSSRNYVTDLFESPTDVLDRYGQRMHGYVVPPLTGDYTFWIATDDQGALYLGTDENPATARLIAQVNGWTPPRQWEVESNQRSAPVRLLAGKAYYVSALMKEGGGGDNLAVRWLMPDGTDQAPIVATNLLPFGVSFTPPAIARHPANTTAVEGSTARFDVALSTVGPAQFIWRRNGSPLPDSSSPELAFGPVRLSDHGARFDVVVTNSLGATTSQPATLSVTPDITPPTVTDVLNLGASSLRITFSEPVSPTSATLAARYTISPDVSVSAARIGSSPNTVELAVATLAIGTTYTLAIDGVTDQAQSPNPTAPGTRVTFVALEYTPATIGTPPIPGSTSPTPGGVNLVASGEIGPRQDAFEFAYQQTTGNFDRRVRVAAFDPTDPFAVAGLMARASLEPNAPFAAAATTPTTIGSFLLTRSSPGANTQRSGSFPPNPGQTWLRLARSGNTFRAYAGFDGLTWTELGSASITMPATVFLGFAASSRDAARTTTVTFRDASNASGSPSPAPTPTLRETPGPSSRLSALTFSEIHYHPRDRADGRVTEFIEIHNADLIDQDLSRHRISGSVSFTFPDGFVIPAGALAVVARNPADLAAIHPIPRLLGPFDDNANLPNSQGLLQLRNPEGAILLEVEYDSLPPWPAAADGAGHSLVLSRPSYGENDPRAWSASATIDGSPGAFDPILPNPFAPIVINELLAHTDLPQLDSVDLGGCFLTDDPATNKFRIPDGTRITPRGFLAFTETTLGFRLDASGETVLLIRPDQSAVIDAVRFGPQENGVASGRFPDGAPEWRRLASVTPDAENAPTLIPPVVINEIHYNPISDDDDDEFIELHNRTTAPVSIAQWSFTDGIDFRFPTNAVIEPNGYVVVARNRARMLARNPALPPATVHGDYSGSLANGGERIALAKPDSIVVTNLAGLPETRRIDIEITEVTYGTGGRWGRWTDGLGSSLELIDPDADPLRPSSWADSDETSKAPWTTIEFTGRVDNVADGVSSSRLHLLAQGPGEYLIDDVEVLPATGPNRLANGTFNNGRTGWTSQGNHRHSNLAENAGPDGSHALRILTTGRGDTAVNRVRANLSTALPVNSTATLRARVRWLRGWPEFLLRTLGNGIEAFARLELPTQNGTPGARNSRAVANAGPAISDVAHSPVVPRPNEAVTVTARVADPHGVAAVSLRFRVDPGTSASTVPMRDDGTNGDLAAGDGIYSARIPGRASGSLVAFIITATDAHPAPASASFPAPDTFPAPSTREALVRWGETKPLGNLGIYRFWQRQQDFNALRSREPLANDPVDCTFVYGDERVIYNAEMRAKGSPWHGGSVGGDYVFAMPDDDRLLGAQDLAVVTLGNLGNDPTAQREQAAFWIGRQMGVASLHRRHVHFFENGAFKGLYEDTEEPNGLYVDHWFPEGEDGDLFKIEDWFEFNDSGNSFVFSRDATLERFTTLGGQLKQARYRWAWRKRAVANSANDYSSLLQLVDTVANPSPSSAPRIEAFVDIENWMRTFALQHIVGNWDAYGHSRGKNSYLYLPTGGRWKVIPWDIDFVLGLSSDGPTADVFSSVDPVVTRLWNVPAFRRAYWRAFLDAVNGPLAPEAIEPVLDGRHAALVANGFNVENPAAIKSYVRQRRDYLRARVASQDTDSLQITSNNGSDFSTAQPTVSLSGSAPLAIQTLLVNGVPFPVSWSTITTWNLSLALGSATNHFVISALDSRGRPIPGFSDSITIRYSGPPISPDGLIVINEIMYNPPSAGGGFLELHNTSTTGAFDLSGWRIDGVGFTFPQGSVIPPLGFTIVASDIPAFRAAYGTSVLPVGQFPGNLQNDGERLRLLRPGPTQDSWITVDDLRYESTPPWPASAAGRGASLQLIDPRLDNRRPANWAATPADASPLATPGQPNSVAASLQPFPNLWINEVQPRNTSGPADAAGDRDPWIELHNAGDTPIALDSFTLSANPSQLNGWSFPQGSSIPPRQFLVVWCDGEPAESSASEIHTPFRLNPTNGVIVLARQQGTSHAPIDAVRYRDLPTDRSLGSFPDGDPGSRSLFHTPSPGAPNTLAAPPNLVFINEWMASNNGAATDPADGDNDDWFELYNAGDTTADLSAFTLTDNLSDPAKFRIPTGTTIPPGGFLLVWADEEPQQTTPTQLPTHVPPTARGATSGHFAPDGSPVDTITFGAQTDNVSQGRYPDGQSAPFVTLDTATPGEPNAVSSANPPPTLAPIPPATADEGATFRFTASASDPDPAQNLTFTLIGAPTAASIDPVTGAFTWTTSETDGPGTYSFSIRVTDDGRPARSDTEPVTLTVREINLPPTLQSPASLKINEGETLTFAFTATDPDLPPQSLTFELPHPETPPGATIDPVTGVFTWTPTEAQGPGTYNVFVGVQDNGNPRLSHGSFVTIAVLEVDNPPVFDPVSLQTVDESSPFSLTIVARDPDTPPHPVTYSLVNPPQGMTIDPQSGEIRWSPSEDDGPGIYPVTVQAIESVSNLPATLGFSVVVNERNEAPILADIPDFEVDEGTTLRFTAVARDADRPPQRLSFHLEPGAPAGASVDPDSGAFSWPIDPDAGAGSHTITLVVTDNAIEARSTARSFTVLVRPALRIVINEIHYAADTPGSEFVELFNASRSTAWPLDGWRLTGFDFTFPAGTTLGATQYLAIARNPSAFQAAFGTNTTPLGDASLNLGPSQPHFIRLQRPSASPDPASSAWETIDEVAFLTSAPWPTNANGRGPSLQLIDATRDNRRLANWSAVTGSTAVDPVTVLTFTNSWHYKDDGPAPAAWRNPDFNDASWRSGPGLLHVEDATLPAPKNTALTRTEGRLTYYFRTRFTFDGNPDGASLVLRTIVDDGAIVHLNGTEILRLGMDPAPATDNTPANRTVGDATLEGPFTLPAPSLLQGDNVLAVEVHQVNATSSDIVWGAQLEVIQVRRESRTPGYANSVRATIPPFPDVWINEVLPLNSGGVTDNAGDWEGWIELTHNGAEPADLAGWWLSDNPDDLTRWPFPTPAILPPNAFPLIWADGEPAEQTAEHWHTPFRLSARGGIVLLVRPQNGVPAVVDFLRYDESPANRSFGIPDPALPLVRGSLSHPTPAAANPSQTPSFEVTGVVLGADGRLLLGWTSEPGRRYRIQTRTSLDAAWSTLPGEITADGPSAGASIEISDAPQGFYRVILTAP
jgi:regulation of enolase protein 1 (concanavalin A-like superfamily)